MTKQPPCATKRPLSRLFRWLAALCCFKLVVLAAALLLDIPLPDFSTQTPQKDAPASASAPGVVNTAANDVAIAMTAVSAPAAPAPQGDRNTLQSQARSVAAAPAAQAAPPRGAAAARLAAAAKPGMPLPDALSDADLPAPLPTAPPTPEDDAALTHPALPDPLPAPRVAPGTVPPQPAPLLAAAPTPAPAADSWLDALSLARLPIPGLGSVRAAQAASLDMPVPQTPATGATSSFTPAAQTAPLSLPGAPPIPADIPRGQSADGSPLPPRGSADVPPLPQPSSATGPAPTPTDPNLKAQELARQQQDIITLRRQMDQRLKDLQSAEKKVQDMIREARGLEDAKIRKLVLTYGQMKPKAAAKALETMDERVAVRILSGMTPKQSGEILTYMNPGQTAKLTELITRMRLPE